MWVERSPLARIRVFRATVTIKQTAWVASRPRGDRDSKAGARGCPGFMLVGFWLRWLGVLRGEAHSTSFVTGV